MVVRTISPLMVVVTLVETVGAERLWSAGHGAKRQARLYVWSDWLRGCRDLRFQWLSRNGRKTQAIHQAAGDPKEEGQEKMLPMIHTDSLIVVRGFVMTGDESMAGPG